MVGGGIPMLSKLTPYQVYIGFNAFAENLLTYVRTYSHKCFDNAVYLGFNKGAQTTDCKDDDDQGIR